MPGGVHVCFSLTIRTEHYYDTLHQSKNKMYNIWDACNVSCGRNVQAPSSTTKLLLPCYTYTVALWGYGATYWLMPSQNFTVLAPNHLHAAAIHRNTGTSTVGINLHSMEPVGSSINTADKRKNNAVIKSLHLSERHLYHEWLLQWMAKF